MGNHHRHRQDVKNKDKQDKVRGKSARAPPTQKANTNAPPLSPLNTFSRVTASRYFEGRTAIFRGVQKKQNTCNRGKLHALWAGMG